MCPNSPHVTLCPALRRNPADLIVEVPLTTHQERKIAETAGLLLNTAAVHEAEGVMADLRITPIVVSMHNHESSDDYACAGCREMAGDGVNSNSQ